MDAPAVARVHLEEALQALAEVRRRARWQRFWGLFQLLPEAWGLLLAAVVLCGPGMALAWSMRVPLWAGALVSASALLAAWGVRAHATYRRVPPDDEMRSLVARPLFDLNAALAALAPGGAPAPFLELREIAQLERDLSELERAVAGARAR